MGSRDKVKMDGKWERNLSAKPTVLYQLYDQSKGSQGFVCYTKLEGRLVVIVFHSALLSQPFPMLTLSSKPAEKLA